MKRTNRLITVLIFIFLYIPMAVLIVASFNTGKDIAHFDGFTLNRYVELFQDDHGNIQEDEHHNGEDTVCLLHAMTPPSSSAPKRFMMPVQTNTSSISTRLRAAPRLGLLPCLN